MKVSMRGALVVGLLLLLHQQASSQPVRSTTGAIRGTVTDSSKAVVPGVTVTLSGSGTDGNTGARDHRRVEQVG